jgi:hypothetical protein
MGQQESERPSGERENDRFGEEPAEEVDRRAPRAERSASSPLRARMRESRRLAKLAHAIKSTRPTAAKSTRRMRR